jgi:para-nitrobenzyl esterase
VEGWVLPQNPNAIIAQGLQNPVPLVVGSNADEMASELINHTNIPTEAAYDQALRVTLPDLTEEDLGRIYDLYPLQSYETPNDAFIQVLTDIIFTCPHRTLARNVASSQVAPVYHYFFTRRAQGAREELPARHGIELIYIFGTLQDIPLYRPVEDELAVSSDMMELWTSFARDGVPSTQGGPTWEPFTLERESYLDIAAPLTTDVGVRADKCDLWDELLGLDED